MSDNKRIAKNSIILYFQLIITTIIGLYTTRIVLLELGTDDYGLYAVVGGIVAMLNFLNTSMLATSYRFIAVEVGKGDEGNPNKVFNTSLVIHLTLAIVILILAETIGVFYVKTYLNVEPGKIPDALFVLHLTALAVVFSVANIPFQGLITANENFSVKATITIIQTLINLGLVLILMLYTGNKLRAYAIIITIVKAVPPILFFIYCCYKYRDLIRWKFNRLKSDYSCMFGFAAWIMIGAIAHMGVRQGAALLINLFFGIALNAAFGIATQIYSHTMMFVSTLNQAAVPQIMKSHSSGDAARSLSLVYKISKYAFLLMLLPAVPIILSIDGILVLWLKEVPEYTKHFAVLMIINGLIGCLGSGFSAAIQATGKIKKIQISKSFITLSTLPIAYLLFKMGHPPYFITIVTIIAQIVALIVMAYIMADLTEFKTVNYFNKTLLPVFFVTILVIPQVFLRDYFGQGIMSIVLFSIISVLLILIVISLVGLDKQERLVLKNLILKTIKIV